MRAIELGVDSFVTATPDDGSGVPVTPSQQLRNLIDEIAHADALGLDAFGIGEHHRPQFLDSASTVLLGAAAARTTRIRLTSAVTVLSSADPVRVLADFATIDLLSAGRAEIVAGRGSFTESFPLFGFRLEDYDAIFAEKLDLLLALRDNERVTWSGKFRPPLDNLGVNPRPMQTPLPIWLGVGGTPASFVRAGVLGLPLMIAIIGGEPRRFRPLVDLYREAGRRAGHDPATLRVGVHAIGYCGATHDGAIADFFPGYAHAFTEAGRERGWPPVTRASFEALRGPTGALVVGDPTDVLAKIRHYDEVLGGIVRINLQMSVAGITHAKLMTAIELLAKDVAPHLRGEAGTVAVRRS